MKYELPYFGWIDLDSPTDYYEAEIEFGGQWVALDLEFGQEPVSVETMDIVRTFLENLEALDRQNISHLIADYQDVEGDTVMGYLQHQLETMGESILNQIVDFQVNTTIPEEQLLRQLHLIGVAFFPDGDDDFAIFDYSISPELTDQLIALYVDKHGELEFMTVERLS